MIRNYKLKIDQGEKEEVDKVEIDVEVRDTDKDGIEYHKETTSTTLERIDQQINNLTERISKLRSEKTLLIADRFQLIADRKNAEKEARKFVLLMSHSVKG